MFRNIYDFMYIINSFPIVKHPRTIMKGYYSVYEKDSTVIIPDLPMRHTH